MAVTTNVFTFNNTVLPASVGPNNPANGAVAISGANLVAGDYIVFDGIIVNNNPATGNGAWGAVDLAGAGTGGVTGATLGVLVRDGAAAGNYCQMWVNATGLGNLGNSPGLATNRCQIILTCTQTGSTANMNYTVNVDQGLTGTFTWTQSGTGLTFANNTVPLTFGSRNEIQTFYQNQPLIAVSAPSPATATAVVGSQVTFTSTITRGFPVVTAQQWLSNGVPIIGATNLTYTTPAAKTSYNGAQFSVVVTNLLVPANVVTSSVAVLTVRTGPGIVPFNFPTTLVAAGGGAVTDPGVALNGSQLLAGDTVVFDGIIIPNGAQLSDAWTAVNIDGSGYGNVVSAQLGALCRMGSAANPSELFINGSLNSYPTPNSAATNRVRIELYPSANGSTTNMGWLVKIDQNLTGNFLPAVSGTNLTFPNNTLPLTFGSSGSASYVYQNPQSPVAIFSGPNPASQVVAVGVPISVGVTVEGWSPAFQWRKNGATIPGATNEDYTSPPATLADNGDHFTVVVSNRLNSLNVITSSVASVAVLIPNNLTWNPTVDYTTWDTVTPNWTTNGGVGQLDFATGNNVTFDSLGYDIGGSTVTVTNDVNPNAVTVNASSYDQYVFTGGGSINGQSLLVTGDGTGTLYLETTNEDAYANVTITAFGGSATTNTLLEIGYNGTDGLLTANYITNNGTLDFNDAGLLPISAVITGSGSVIQDGSGTTVLSSTNSAYTIQAINNGTLSIASSPNPGVIQDNGVLEPASSASVLVISNTITGSGALDFLGFQTTILLGQSSITGENPIVWGPVIVDNPLALGDTNSGLTDVNGADKFGGLYLSNNIAWSQQLQLDTRYTTGQAATAPHLANWGGTNDVVSSLIFGTGAAAGTIGSEINVEATTGQLTIDAASTLVNNAGGVAAMDLNLQGAGIGFWNGILTDSSSIPLNLLKRGTGTWTLGGLNTYSGTTTVAAGTLLITNQIGAGNVTVQAGGTLGGDGLINGAVTVAAGGTLTLTPGQGLAVLAIDNTLTLSPGSFTRLQINKTAKTNDVITGVTSLTYGGTLVITNLAGTLTTSDAFPLFSATGYTGAFSSIQPAQPGAGLAWNTNTLAVDGTLRLAVATGPVTYPTNITARVSGATLTLSWPADHLGWRLLVQTNHLTAGLSANTNDWTTVAGSASLDLTNLTINPALPAEFYRLVYP